MNDKDNKIVQIPLEQLQEHRQNSEYFHSLKGDEFRLLCQSLREQGILTPLLITEESAGVYTLLSGHQRLRAARELGMESVPCIVASRHNSATEQLDILLQANIGRSLKYIEKLKIASHMILTAGCKQGQRSDLAQVGRSLTREEIAEQTELTRNDITLLNKIHLLPEEQQQNFYHWINESNPKKQTLQKRLKQALEQNRKYKAADKELNQLKRKARLARELQTAAEQIQCPEDYQSGRLLNNCAANWPTFASLAANLLVASRPFQFPTAQL